MSYRRRASPKDRCPTCREALLFLRWGHEERCSRFVAGQRVRRFAVVAALLVLTLALCVPA